MPIERETKYLLRPRLDVIETLEHLVQDKGWKRHIIIQAYIASSARIRKKYLPDAANLAEYTFTYKYDLPDFSVVEMECPISGSDFRTMHSTAEVKLIKVRFSRAVKMDGDDGEGWDIDVFYNGEDPYCILAECEMFGNRIVPTKLPGVVERNLIHTVRPGDKGFASKHIADVKKTIKIINAILALEAANNA